MLTTRSGAGGHDNLLPEIRFHAEATIDYFNRNRRFARFVDTRQKWLLVHLIAVTCHEDGLVHGAAANWICERASSLGIASRNTSLAFFNQLTAYGYLQRRDHRGDRRLKLISLSEATRTALADWTLMLIEAATGEAAAGLDRDVVMDIYFETASALLQDPRWVKAPLDVCLTQDMRGGWLVMSDILRHMPKVATGDSWVPAPGLSIPAMTETFGLSRSTLYRLVRLSVEAGIMAWQDRQSVSTLNVNLYHLRQYSRWLGRSLDAAADSYRAAFARLPSRDGSGFGGGDPSDSGHPARRFEVAGRTALGA
jgi:hypothetical protein